MLLSKLPTGLAEIFASVQGEGASSGEPAVFVRLSGCNLKCRWCFVPETPVLMADWTWKPIGTLGLGDEVAAIRRGSRPGEHNKLVAALVTAVGARDAETVWVDGIVRCTPDHPFWITGKNANGRSVAHSGWRAAGRIEGQRVLFTSEPITHDRNLYERGWLAGVADGDGCFGGLHPRREYRRFRLAVNDEGILNRAKEFASRGGFTLRPGKHIHTGFSGRREVMNCLWLTVDAEARAFESWVLADVDDIAWRSGYLGGILDAEGSWSRGILRLAQSASANARQFKRIEAILERSGFAYSVEAKGFYVHRTAGAVWNVLNRAKPVRRQFWIGSGEHHPHANRRITTVERAGRSTVITLSTSAGSYVAGGYVVKNCDTPYTWDWSRFDPARETTQMDVAGVAQRVLDLAGGRVRTAVLTGGEPLLQQRELAELARRLRSEKMRVEVETNGTVVPEPALASEVDQWNVSPKLSGSGNAPVARERSESLSWFSGVGNASFKFVVAEPNDVQETAEFVSRHGIPAANVILMPEGTTRDSILERSRWLSEAALAHGFRLGSRLHVLLWGDERGR